MSKKLTLSAMLLAAMCTISINNAKADETILADCVDTCGNKVVAGFDLLFLRPHRQGGANADNLFGFESTPRFMLAYETARGAGVRAEYLSFDHAEGVGLAGNLSSIDMANLDIGIYKRIGLGQSTNVEFSGGVRFNEYDDQNWAIDAQSTSFSGWGGYLGMQAWHDLGWDTSGYVRGKWAVLMGNGGAFGVKGFDLALTQQELAIGLEKTFCVCGVEAAVHGGWEWQNWEGYGATNVLANGGTGFGGWAFGLSSSF